MAISRAAFRRPFDEHIDPPPQSNGRDTRMLARRGSTFNDSGGCFVTSKIDRASRKPRYFSRERDGRPEMAGKPYTIGLTDSLEVST